MIKPKFYSYPVLKKVAESRGYMSGRAIAYRVAPFIGKTEKTTMNKLISGSITTEESLVIASLLEMSPQEYYEVFMFGAFKQTSYGRYVCHIDEYQMYREPPKFINEKEEEKKRTSMEIIEELERL